MKRASYWFWLISSVLIFLAIFYYRKDELFPFPLHDELKQYFVPIRYLLSEGFGTLFSSTSEYYYRDRSLLFPVVLSAFSLIFSDNIFTYRWVLLGMSIIGATAMAVVVLRQTKSFIASGIFLLLLCSSMAFLPHAGVLVGDSFTLFWFGLFILSWQSNHWSSCLFAVLFAYSRENTAIVFAGMCLALILRRQLKSDYRTFSILLGTLVAVGWHAYAILSQSDFGAAPEASYFVFTWSHFSQTFGELFSQLLGNSFLIIPALMALCLRSSFKDGLIVAGSLVLLFSFVVHGFAKLSLERYQLVAVSLFIMAVVLAGEKFKSHKRGFFMYPIFIMLCLGVVFKQWHQHSGLVYANYNKPAGDSYLQLLEELLAQGYTKGIMLPRTPGAWLLERYRAYIRPDFINAQAFSDVYIHGSFVSPKIRYLVLDVTPVSAHSRQSIAVVALQERGVKFQKVYTTKNGLFEVQKLVWPIRK